MVGRGTTARTEIFDGLRRYAKDLLSYRTHVPRGVLVEGALVGIEQLVVGSDEDERLAVVVDECLGAVSLVAKKTEYSDVLLQLVAVGLDRGD